MTAHRPLLRSQIAGCGAYLPERVVTNDELAQLNKVPVPQQSAAL